MKKSYKFLIGIALLGMMGMTACTDDLNTEPTNPNELMPDKFKQDPDKYMQSVFADVALNFVAEGPSASNILSGVVSNGGFAVFSRAVFNLEEMPTDEATWLYYTNDAGIGTLPFGICSTAQEMAIAPYYRFVVNASLANNFIASCDNGEFAGADANNMAFLRLQATVLREICMYYLLDIYGNVPWIDDNSPVGSTPTQMESAEIYRRLTAEMESTVAKFDNVRKDIPYGYFGKDCCEAYLVKLYLNAKTYCGTADWANAYKHAKAIIDRHQGEGFQGSGLAMNYNQLFGQGNQKFAPGGGGVNEILWTLPGTVTRTAIVDGEETSWGIETWGAAVLFTQGMFQNTGSNDLAAMYNLNDQWNCITCRVQLARTFDWDDDAMSISPDQRVRFWLTSQYGYDFTGYAVATDAPHAGYSPIKYSNWVIKDNGDIDYDASGPVINGGRLNIDFAMVRLAEIYLSAAEAIHNGGGGTADDALKYVNYIRNRAGLNSFSTLTTEDLRAERQRELYTECTRRTDLKRYGQWISGYNWAFKGSPSNRDGQNFPESFNYYPLPSPVVSMAGYKQNPGY